MPELHSLMSGALEVDRDSIHEVAIDSTNRKADFTKFVFQPGSLAWDDSFSTAIEDLIEVESDAQPSRRLGFGAKSCIHPKQVEAVNRNLIPSAGELLWADRVIAVASSSPRAIVALNGKMTDKSVILQAEAILCDSWR